MTRNEDTENPEPIPDLARYSRQMLFEHIGEAGQRRLLDSRVTMVGCGALGTVIANTLVRAGVGHLRIIDRDFIEPNNLQRQVLFDEDDIAANLPKAEAARRKLGRINSAVRVEAVVADVNHTNIERFAEGAGVLLDATDNFESRFLVNDVSVKHGVPWVYGACVSASGLVMPIVPNETPCLRCVFDEAPPPEMNPTCDTVGILAAVVNVVGSLQALEAMKVLMGRHDQVTRRLLSIDVWSGRVESLNVQSAYEKGDCRCCKHREFEYLSGGRHSAATTLCGRRAVQVSPLPGLRIDFAAIADRIAATAMKAEYSEFLLRAKIPPYEITVFADGRAIITGTNDPAEARTVYARYVGA